MRARLVSMGTACSSAEASIGSLVRMRSTIARKSFKGAARTGRRRAAETPLEIAEPNEQLVERNERRPPREPNERHLERRARLSALGDVVERLREAVEETQEIVDLGAAGERHHVLHFFVREIEQLAPALAAHLGDDEVPQAREQIARDV